MHEVVLSFFRNYELACTAGNDADAAACFAEGFFYSDGVTAKMLPRVAISAAAVQRRLLMAQAGLGASVLEQIEVHPLDLNQAWAATTWVAKPTGASTRQLPVVLRATYLVRIQDGVPRIVAYLSHTSFDEALSRSREP